MNGTIPQEMFDWLFVTVCSDINAVSIHASVGGPNLDRRAVPHWPCIVPGNKIFQAYD